MFPHFCGDSQLLLARASGKFGHERDDQSFPKAETAYNGLHPRFASDCSSLHRSPKKRFGLR
jgi:hypothetical protein